MQNTSADAFSCNLLQFKILFALGVWVGCLVFVCISWFISLLFLPIYPLFSITVLSTLLFLTITPIDSVRAPRLARRFLTYTLDSAYEYFPINLVFEDEAALQVKQPYVIAYEPHSVLPQGITVFSKYGRDKLPAGLHDVRILVSSALFWAAGVRFLWHWLGYRPCSRHIFGRYLDKGTSVAICPGGVQEVLHMDKGKEVVYLKRRKGFITIALMRGSPVIPVFAFGQTEMFGYMRPFMDWPKGFISKSWWAKFVRRIGYVPLIIWGVLGTPLPRQRKLTIVVGRPLYVPNYKGESPPPEVVDEWLNKFIESLKELFERHRASAGCSLVTLEVH